MRNLDDVIESLRAYMKEADKLERDRKSVLRDTSAPKWIQEERAADLKKQIETNAERINRVLRDLTIFPPFHERHTALLKDFHQIAPFNSSVFIMTKFHDPKSQDERDVRLGEIIRVVQEAITRCQHSPRIASEKDYHKSLWDNVELHLLGCSRGVAIVEDKHTKELNPNVAMEWGWMVGMGRRVLYLVEKDFKHGRADWGGLINEQFDWDGDGDDIRAAVHKFLGCTLQH